MEVDQDFYDTNYHPMRSSHVTVLKVEVHTP